jgi:hypothetical protein
MSDRELAPGRLNDLRLAWAGAKWRARLRYEVGILRHRLSMRLGGGGIQAALDALDDLLSNLDALSSDDLDAVDAWANNVQLDIMRHRRLRKAPGGES